MATFVSRAGAMIAVAAVAAFGTAGIVIAQQAGFTRTALQTQDLSTPGRVAVQARAEFDPGVAAGRHTHPGEELARQARRARAGQVIP